MMKRQTLSGLVVMSLVMVSSEAWVSEQHIPDITLATLASEAQFIVVAKGVKDKPPWDSEPFVVVENLLSSSPLAVGTHLTVFSADHDFKVAMGKAIEANRAAGRGAMDGLPGMIVHRYSSSVSEGDYPRTRTLVLFLLPYEVDGKDHFRLVRVGAYESVAKKSQVAAAIAHRKK
jgi:hypothetical protein